MLGTQPCTRIFCQDLVPEPQCCTGIRCPDPALHQDPVPGSCARIQPYTGILCRDPVLAPSPCTGILCRDRALHQIPTPGPCSAPRGWGKGGARHPGVTACRERACRRGHAGPGGIQGSWGGCPGGTRHAGGTWGLTAGLVVVGRVAEEARAPLGGAGRERDALQRCRGGHGQGGSGQGDVSPRTQARPRCLGRGELRGPYR